MRSHFPVQNAPFVAKSKNETVLILLYYLVQQYSIYSSRTRHATIEAPDVTHSTSEVGHCADKETAQRRMVLPRRSHARPTRRRHGVSLATGTALLVGLVFCLVYALRPLSSSSLSSSSASTLPSSPQSSSPALQHAPLGVLPLADLLTGNPPKWRDPKRDFDAEYEEVLEAMPELRSTRRARIAFLIMAHGPTDVQLLKRSLPWLYSPLNFFLVS